MPKAVDIYVLDKKIGSGQFGDVFRGYSKKDGTEVAVKCISRNLIKGKFNELLENEIQVLKSCRNSNIVRLLDIKKTANNIYLIMEYCNQGDLGGYVKQMKKLPEREAVEFFIQILNAFQTLVRNKIMHRDFKLANVLKHNGVIKVADFGFSKLLDCEDQTVETILGSPLNMAPEVLDKQHYNTKADIWSIGVTFFQMLFGCVPFTAGNIVDLLKKIKRDQLVFPAPISAPVENVIRQMLVVDPHKRIDWNDLFKHPVTTMLEEELQSALSKSMVCVKDQIPLQMSRFYIKTNKLIQNPHEIHQRADVNRYIKDVAAERTLTQYKGKIINRITERPENQDSKPFDLDEGECDEPTDCNLMVTDQGIPPPQIASKKAKWNRNDKIILHGRNCYAFCGLLAEELIELHLNPYAECLAFLSLKKALLRINTLLSSTDSNSLPNATSWEDYKTSQQFATLKGFIRSEQEIFSRFYERLSLKVLREDTLSRFQQNLMLSGRFSPQETQHRIYLRVLREYVDRVLQKNKLKISNTIAVHLRKLIDSQTPEMFEDVDFDFSAYYARHQNLQGSTADVYEKEVEKHVLKFLKSVN